jgi:PTS system N-acetylglucosamine-specific IIC component
LGILHGFGFSAGFIDYFLNWGLATKPILIIPVGLVFGAIYYLVFVWVIKALDIPTPGRVDEEMDESVLSNLNVSDFSVKLVERLGGKSNIDTLDACITRLRMTVKDANAIDEAALKSMGIKGILKKANNVQVIVGTRAELIADEMKKSIRM